MSDDEATQTETNDTMPAPLAAKIAEVMGHIENVPKNGEVSFRGTEYEYAMAEDIFNAAQDAMSKAGVAIIPSVIEQDWSESGNTVFLTMEYTIMESETGATWTSRWVTQGNDSGDKAYWKAMTQSKKYFLRDIFCIPTGNPKLDAESDHTETDHTPNAQGQRQSSRNGGQTSRQPSQSSGGRSTPDVDRETQTKRLHALLGEVTLADRYQSALRTYIRRKAGLDDDAEWSEVPASHIKGWADKIDAMDTDQSGGPSERNRKIIKLCKSQGLVDDTDAAAE